MDVSYSLDRLLFAHGRGGGNAQLREACSGKVARESLILGSVLFGPSRSLLRIASLRLDTRIVILGFEISAMSHLPQRNLRTTLNRSILLHSHRVGRG